MKTRQILFSVALCAAFTACTSDDDFKMPAENNATDAMLSIRPEVGSEITLGDNILTRLALGEGARPVWGSEDRIGAAIIDYPDYTSQSDYETKLKADPDHMKLYKINGLLGCNNAFSTKNSGNTWSAEHPMVEGNYLFYAPYNEDLSLRAPLVIEVPKEQDASGEGEKSALKEFYESGKIVRIGYKFITSDERQMPKVTMQDIFAYPQFTITNNFNGYLFDEATASAVSTMPKYSGPMKVDKIVFKNVDGSGNAKNDFIVGGPLKLKATDDVAANQTSGVISKLKEKANGFDADGEWNNRESLLKAGKTADLIDDTQAIKTDGTSRDKTPEGVITTLTVNKEIPAGGSISLYCVMPACKFDYSTSQLMADVYVTIQNKQYVIREATFSMNKVELSAAATKGYMFTAKDNPGLTSLSFMAGQRLPAEAIGVEGEGEGERFFEKTGVKGLFTIVLEGGDKKTGGTSDVQIAVSASGAEDTGLKTNEALIEKIRSAANGTAWKEGEDDGTHKGFSIAKDNSVEINSALIEALVKYNSNGGSFEIESVVPISGDVEIKSESSNELTLVSNKGNEYKIKLSATNVETTGNAEGKYAVIASTEPSDTDEKTVAIITGTVSTLTKTKLKSMHVIKTSGNVTVDSELEVVGDIRVDGELTLSATKSLKAAKVYNKGTMKLSAGVTADDVTNDGKIEATTNDASVTISAGKGTVTVNETSTSQSIVVNSGVEQTVIYECGTSDDVDGTMIEKAAKVPSVNAIKAGSGKAVKLTADDMSKFGKIKTIYPDATINSENGTYDMSGYTIVLTQGTTTWTGEGVATTVVNGVTIEGDNNLTLTNISVNGTAEAEGKVTANGTNAKWNGEKSPKD